MAVWQMSRKITLLIYQATRAFPKEEMFGISTLQVPDAEYNTPTHDALLTLINLKKLFV
ncbi:MAG TPA: four helix bundle protein [Saprospiraceae bacterium]|nr:four helix bundle protein [Saprospiraceae bacterium]HNL39311.1 four helix bundle protein [Saprospiraceae bacterium]HNM27226.1 four helix bundle protein [Saprospiraceae bacterium]